MKRLIVMIGLSALCVLMGCNDAGDGGTLRTDAPVRLELADQSSGAKAILPVGQTLEISQVEVTGNGPEGASLHADLATETTTEGFSATLGYLELGSWTFEARAKNKEGTVLATGTAAQSVYRDTRGIPLKLTSRPGSGSLKANITWDDDVLPATGWTLTASLTDANGNAVDVQQTDTAGDVVVTATSLTSGYYLLAVTLKNGDEVVGGGIDSVFVVENVQSAGTIEVPIGILSQTTGMEFSNNMEMPIQGEITTDPAQGALTKDTHAIKLTYKPKQGSLVKIKVPMTALKYQWYCDGVAIPDATTREYTISPPKQAKHRYDMIVRTDPEKTKKQAMGSSSVTITMPTR